MPTREQQTLRRLSAMETDARGNVLMNTTVSDTVGRILGSIENDDIKLKVNRIWVNEKYDNRDIAAQQDVRNKGQIWGNELRADLSLIDKKTGKTIDRTPSIKISSIPKLTDRGTFLLGGNEYQFTKQSRLKPGVYTREQANGEISSFFNVDKTIDFERGFNRNFKINFNPERRIFTMTYGSKNVPLINALRAVGVTRKELVDRWGESVYEANAKAYDKHEGRDQNKLYQAIFGFVPAATLSPDEIRTQIRERLFATELDSDTTKITLGKSYKNVNKGSLLDASRKIIDIHRGDVKGDDREALIFKSFYDAEDHVRERLIKNSNKIIGNIRHKLGKMRTINKSISSQLFDPFVIGTITNSQLSNPPTQTNVTAIVGESSKMTVMGEGGIGTTSAITNETRKISNSEAGYVDPLHTPEGNNIGVAVHMSMDTIKAGNDLYGKFVTPKGEKVLLRPVDTWGQKIAFPDEYDMTAATPKPKRAKVRVISRGEFTEVPAGQVDAIIGSPQGMFDTSANMIPFLDSIQGNRGLTASKMQEQALPLASRERPLFRVVDQQGNGISEMIASTMALPTAPLDGAVTKVTPSVIEITDRFGRKHTQQLYHNFSLNAESFLHNEPLVKMGDRVKKGQPLADNNFTRNGQIAVGANLRVAYMPYKGFNYEDSAIMGESAAKKLTSEHMYDYKAKRSAKGVFSKGKFRAYYPEELPAKQAAKLDADGVVKPGEIVDRDDVLIAHMERRAPTADDIALGRLDKQLRRDMSNNAQKWNHDSRGVVTGVQKHGNSVVVSVKAQEPLKEADKISGLHGNKHIISKIVPDDQMPYDPRTGQYIDLTMSPIGVSNRINTSQLLENAAGKIAQKTGKQYVVRNFTEQDNSRKIMKDLQASGLSDKDMLIDPETGKPFKNPIANGLSHILKLEHKVDHKFSARYKEGYDANEQPVVGGKTGAKNLGRMEMAALLARGANENLREMFQIKGQRNDEYWRAMETGQSLPPPKRAFVWDKMLASMAGAGINVEQKGKVFTLKPMTDDEILNRSKGELNKPTLTYRKKDLAPLREGLFDPVKAGGMQGDHFTHFALPEPVLNPVTAPAAANLLNMPLTALENIVNGKQFVERTTGNIVKPGTPNAFSGGPAVEMMLGRVNVNTDLTQAESAIEKARNPSEINKLNRRIKTLRFFKRTGMKPTDYMHRNVLVTPSKFRPLFTMGTDNTVIMSDVNDLYQQVGYTSEALTGLKAELQRSVKNEDIQNLQLAESRGALYQDVKAVMGLQEPTSYINRSKNKKGFITQIDGGKTRQTKEGFFQDKVLERRQDVVGRSTIILNPTLGGDEIGIPKEMATQIFQPFIMKKLVSWGYPPLEAQKHVREKSKIFDRARQVVADERLVIANRAPTLHRWNMTAFKPKLTEGKSIEVPAVVVSKNFGGDFDGDTFQIHAPIGPRALREAEKMKPSASMLKTGYDSVLNQPQMDMIVGDWLVSKGKGGKDTALKFNDMGQARFAFKNHEFTYGDKVTVAGRKAPFGMHEINSVVPDNSQRWGVELNAQNTEDWIRNVTKQHNGKIGLGLADKLKEVGNDYSTTFGFTLGVSDTLVNDTIRRPLIQEAKLKSRSGTPEAVVKAYYDATQKGHRELARKHGEATMLGIGIKSGGTKGIGNTAAITLMPGIVTDADDKPIPIPLTKAYSEGLSTSDYWAAAHGARGGNIKKSVSSFKPGWLTKDLINSIYETRIAGDEPVDTEGLEYPVEDKKGIFNRYLAQDAKDAGGKIVARRNEIVTSDTVNKLNQRGIKTIRVQSPLTDPTPNDGFSSYSYGVDYEGNRHNIGDNIGIISAHTITEPSLNLAMKAFHTGGMLEPGKKGIGTVFDRLDRTLRFTRNLPDKATVASMDGNVRSIDRSPIGGWDVVLGNGDREEVRYVDPNNTVTIKKGQWVGRGDRISTGTASVHDILKYKGMPATQRFLIDEVDKVVDGKLDKRDIETVVRGITNTTRILSPGSSSFVVGDVAQLTAIENYNRNNEKEQDLENTKGDHLAQNYGPYRMHTKIDDTVLRGLDRQGKKRIKVFKDRIKHEPFLTPTGIQAKAAASEDWIARLAHNRIRRVLEEGTTQGWKTTIDPKKGHPLPAYVTGEFSW